MAEKLTLTPGQLAMYWGLYDREGKARADSYLRLITSNLYLELDRPGARCARVRREEAKIAELERELQSVHRITHEEISKLQLECDRLRLENQMLRQGFAA